MFGEGRGKNLGIANTHPELGIDLSNMEKNRHENRATDGKTTMLRRTRDSYYHQGILNVFPMSPKYAIWGSCVEKKNISYFPQVTLISTVEYI